jgi:hypothetical protein
MPSAAGRALTFGGRLDNYSSLTLNQPMMPDRPVFIGCQGVSSNADFRIPMQGMRLPI